MITQTEVVELVNLYHLANTALVVKGLRQAGRYDRMCWAVDAFCRERPSMIKIRAYKALDEALT